VGQSATKSRNFLVNKNYFLNALNIHKGGLIRHNWSKFNCIS
jgi:hypothetical protein